jgi:hypothetical protein
MEFGIGQVAEVASKENGVFLFLPDNVTGFAVCGKYFAQ